MRGKVLGGSSSINVMAYTRGNRGDYDRWAQKGARGWSYADVLPYFRRAETWEERREHVARRRRSARHRIRQDARSALRRLDRGRQGVRLSASPRTTTASTQEGFGRGQYTIRDGRRSSSARAYLQPARKRAQSHGRDRRACDAHPDAGHARDRRRIRQAMQATADAAEAREVIVSGGTFNSPQLLMLSGIGPAAHLREMGIACVVDLPVGKNLQDHLGAYMTYTRQTSRRVPRRDALRPHGGEHDPRLSLRHRPGDGGARRPACLRQDAAGARGARHRVHVPRHLAPSASVVSAALSGLRRRLRHPPDAAASGQPRRGARCARPIRAIRRASATTSSPRRTTCRRCGKASSWRARLAYQPGARSLSRRRAQPRRRRCRPTPRSTPGCARP